MAKKRVADVLIETRVVAGVKRVYGLVGDSTASPIRFVHGKFSAFARLICDRDVTRHRGLWL
jgi:hypothetical protein